MNALSVSTLNNQIKSLLETTFMGAYVEGEISNLTYHASGHIYFSIKDESSSISCVMFKGNARYLKFNLEMGMKVLISGSISVYTPRGSYQLMCTKLEPSGQGALALAYEQLKSKLQLKGYFDSSNKKTLPKYPKKVALVTSGTGAAIEDMKKIAIHRWPLVEFILIPTLVQGDGSACDIVQGIKIADKLACDVIVVGRGGGSKEDLWSFNEEIVCDAIYEANTPIVSAVGHEIDHLLSDFVADVRAATPSNAIEIILPDINEHRMYLDSLRNDLSSTFRYSLEKKENEIINYKKLYEQNSISTKFTFVESEINILKNNFNKFFEQIIYNKELVKENLAKSFEISHPDNKIKKGFAQVIKDKKIIELDDLKTSDEFYLESAKSQALCKIINMTKI
ncbi:MAG: exodeoxyribonuclease VII large subunit [Campylobacteraceae bacterium]|nr:exodeoxyribonuclease VII large subunit [Campylobacteraceae bacterium]